MKLRSFNEWDVLKSISILLVVIGHVTILYKPNGSFPDLNNAWLSEATDIIYLFHMPLFITISGAIYAIGYDKGKYSNILTLLNNKFKRLIVPYLVVSLCFLTPILLFLSMESGGLQSWINILLGLECRHLWYLYALFEIFIIVRVLQYMNLSLSICMTLSIILSVVFTQIGGIHLFCLNMTIYYLPYFYLGIFLLKKKLHKQEFFFGFVLVLLLLFLIKFCDIFLIDSILSLLLAGIIVTLIISAIRLVSVEAFFSIPYMDKILANSFGIYLFHVPIIYVIYHFYSKGYWIILLTIVAFIVISLLMCVFLRKFKLQAIIGE